MAQGLLTWPFANPAYQHPYQPFGTTSFQGELPCHGYAHWHAGDDFDMPAGTPLLAAGPGTVLIAGPDTVSTYNGGYGSMVFIDHGNSLYTLCGHMSRIDVATSATVTDGQQIGLSGSSGNSTGPHLHFGVTTNSNAFDNTPYVDPLPYLSAAPDQSGLGVGLGDYSIAPGMAVYLARHAGIPEDQLAIAVAICAAESGFAVSVTNHNSDGSTDYGLWQINSVHCPPYDAGKLTNDPFYNAQAMADLSRKGADWTPWSSYTSGAYKGGLSAAQAAVQETPASLTAADLGLPTARGSYYDNNPGIDTYVPPAPPPDTLPIVRVRLSSRTLQPRAGYQATAALWINGAALPVIDAQAVRTARRKAGSWQATLALATFDTVAGGKALEEIFARKFSQVIVYMGYVRDPATATLAEMDAVFTGLIDPPGIDAGSYTATLSGPDLSGVFSDPSTTAQLDQLTLPDGTAFLNADTASAIAFLVNRHRSAGDPGLGVSIDPTAGLVGGIYGQDAVSTPATGYTEWDIITRLAEGEGCAAWFDGTTLNVRRVAPGTATLTLPYGGNKPPSFLQPPRFQPGKHAKRDYRVEASTYDTRQGQLKTALAGNAGSPQLIQVNAPPNYSHDDLQKLADSTLAYYAATERLASLPLAGIIPVEEGQKIVIDADENAVYRRLCGEDNPYYPVQETYTFSKDAGLTMTLSCTNLPIGAQTKNTQGL